MDRMNEALRKILEERDIKREKESRIDKKQLTNAEYMNTLRDAYRETIEKQYKKIKDEGRDIDD